MPGHRLHEHRDDHADRHRDDNDREERHVPVPEIGDVDAGGDAEHLARRERGLNDAHHAPAHRERKQVGDDRENDGADHAAEDAGDHARDQELRIARRQRAQRGADDETAIEEQQELLAVEAVGEARREQARGAGAEGIGGDDLAEPLRRDVEVRHDDRAERRDDHEVEDDGELQKGEQRHQELLVGGKFRRCGLCRRLPAAVPRLAPRCRQS